VTDLAWSGDVVPIAPLCLGGTGSGKTTLLHAMSQFIDHSERIVTIEDAGVAKSGHLRFQQSRPSTRKAPIGNRPLLNLDALYIVAQRVWLGDVRAVGRFAEPDGWNRPQG
jgi:pilus assembly protein CpaF